MVLYPLLEMSSSDMIILIHDEANEVIFDK